MEYQDPETGNYNQNEQYAANSAARGLKIAIAILLVVLLAVCVLYWRSVQNALEDKALVQIELDTLQSKFGVLQGDMELIKFDNDTLNQHLVVERHKADSLIQKLKKERNYNYATVKKYERELGTLRSAMQGFVRQIDSLNRLNKKLVGENLAYRKELSTYRLRTEAAEETASELNTKIQKGAIIRARDISLSALNKRDKAVTRAQQAQKLVASFILAGNELARAGERRVYASIVTPDGIVLQEGQGTTINFEGQNIPYSNSREIDYQNEDLPVSIIYNGKDIAPGTYTVMIYMDGHMIGTNAVILR